MEEEKEPFFAAARKARSFDRTIAFLSLALNVALLGVVVGLSLGLYGSVKNHVTEVGSKVDSLNSAVPKAYVVEQTAVTPAKDQMQRGTCWAFSTIGVLESSYRKYATSQGWLSPDEYVAFSEQAYAISVVNYCTKNKDDPYCFGGPPTNTTEDGEPEWLYYMRDALNVVLPTAVCPYTPTNQDQFVCPDYDKAAGSNPISFSVNGIESAYSLDGIKRLLWSKKQPLSWSHAVYQSDNNSLLYQSQQCQACMFPCRESSDGCCAQLIVPSYTNEGVFFLHDEPFLGGGHAMLLVGWNDDRRVDRGLFGDLNAYTQGGFIIKNSWNYAIGHSMMYWMQNISMMDESFICPCEKSSRTWLSANHTCMLQSPDPVACAPGMRKMVRRQWLEGATVLKCTDKALHRDTARWLGYEGCDPSKRYVLASLDVPEDYRKPSGVWTLTPAQSDGYVRFYLVSWNPDNDTIPVELVLTNDTTWYGLENIFEPEVLLGNSEECGFFFHTYETFLEGNYLYPWWGHDTPAVTYFDISWHDSSFLNNAASFGTYDYSYITNSTIKSEVINFVGPFDYDANVPPLS